MKTPLTSETLKHHFTYHWWLYLLVLVMGPVLVSLSFDTVLAHRIPEEKRVDLYISGLVDEPSVNAYMERVRESELPDMESMKVTVLYQDETYGPVQLSTYVAAHEGDLYLLPRDYFLTYASSEAFLPLEDDEELMAIFNEAGLNLKRGWRTLNNSDETHLYGIPSDLLPGLNSMCYVENGYLTVTSFGGNTENAMKFLRILCRDMLTAPAAAEEGV